MPVYLVDLVYLVYSVSLVNRTDEIDQTDSTDQIDQTDLPPARLALILFRYPGSYPAETVLDPPCSLSACVINSFRLSNFDQPATSLLAIIMIDGDLSIPLHYGEFSCLSAGNPSLVASCCVAVATVLIRWR